MPEWRARDITVGFDQDGKFRPRFEAAASIHAALAVSELNALTQERDRYKAALETAYALNVNARVPVQGMHELLSEALREKQEAE